MPKRNFLDTFLGSAKFLFGIFHPLQRAPMKKVYIVGIEGAGTSALAVLYRHLGHQVSGSDDGNHFYAGPLEKYGIPVHGEFSAEHVPADADSIVYSTAFERNVEVEKGRELGIETLSYPEAVARLFNASFGIAVSGTHGKTTTSAMLACLLRDFGEEKAAIIGGRVNEWDGNTLIGEGKYFVLEADEYQNKLRHYDPLAVILTSVDWDHPDFFPDFETYKTVFREFVKRIPKHGVLVYWNDSSDVADIAKEAICRKISYGFLPGADFLIREYVPIRGAPGDGAKQSFELIRDGDSLGTFELKLVGKHNALNAAAIVALASFLKLDIGQVRSSLRGFSGTGRRFEWKGERNDAIIYDDYAHHPEEIRATLRGFRDLYPDKRIVVLFHPHTFSRTKALLTEFAQSFGDADEVLVLDIYGSAREESGTVSSPDLVREINRYVSKKALYVKTFDDAYAEIEGKLGGGDVFVTIGAGDVWQVAERLVESKN
jgi:UDP-N-acetylmuramate--alanine ligase